ncbi:MAG: AAA family ATPase [Bacteroidales bacterium]|nr:AAA family ATPase [Bacteroidales bacterium]
MVNIVGKIDLENGIKKKLDSFKAKIIEILEKHRKNTLALGIVLHEMGAPLKNDVKNAFPLYKIPTDKRKNKNDTFDWPLFFKENLAPQFQVEVSEHEKNGDVLHYHPENSDANNKVAESGSLSDATIVELPETLLHDDPEPQVIEKTQYHNMTQKEINDLLRKILEELNGGLYEKERSVRLTLLAVLAGESTFMLGEPGTAKSLVARRISEAFEEPENKDEIKFFDYLMNQFSTPEEVFGPVSITELKNDNYVRKTEKYLPKAQFAFLDEIWKANPAIQNALLTILNEKIFRNGTQVEEVPLIGFMSASNELPAKDMGLDAIFDRFLVRILEKPISDEDNFRSMISAGKNLQVNVSRKLTKEIINQILKESENVVLTDECFDIIQSVRKAITDKNNSIKDEAEKFIVSDRRWKKIVNLMRVSAYCNNRTETDLMDASLIADCIWSTEKQETEAKRIVANAIKAYGIQCKSDDKLLKDKVTDFKNDIDENFYQKKTDEREKTVTIKSRKYYEVKVLDSDDSEVCYIASNSHKDYNSSRKCYYFASDVKAEPTEIIASYDSSTRVYMTYDRYGYKKSDYVVQMEETEPYLVKRTDIPKKTLNATVNSFDRYADNLEIEIESAKKQVEDEENILKVQKRNLFANSDDYGGIIFKEHINCKSELNKLLKELEKQRQRYQ